jgi:hypothetical protein
MTSPDDAEPGSAPRPASPGPPPPGPASPGPAGAVPGGELLPERSREDTDAAWGDLPERDDDRLSRDRPPHWDDL